VGRSLRHCHERRAANTRPPPTPTPPTPTPSPPLRYASWREGKTEPPCSPYREKTTKRGTEHCAERVGEQVAHEKIALEEHFWTEGFPHTGKAGADLFDPWFLRLVDERLGELSELRIAAMDAAGIDVSVLSLISPACRSSATPPKR